MKIGSIGDQSASHSGYSGPGPSMTNKGVVKNNSGNGAVVLDVKWKGEGCAISQAAMSILSDELLDMNLDEVIALENQDILDMLGVEITPRRTKCALLSLLTLRNAFIDMRGGEPLKFVDLIG